jgi:Iap family predicted aminopeptidase
MARNLQRIIIRLGDYGRKTIASPTPGIVALIRQVKANKERS